ncbi:TPA: hypothetical protein U1617_001287 [Streptococcus suis]|nr:hypothetical protein [Streptococcus suis]
MLNGLSVFFREHDLVQKIKTSARQGYSGYLIEVFSVKDEYIRRRLENERTLKELRKVLGAGFNVEYEVSYSKNILTGDKYVAGKKSKYLGNKKSQGTLCPGCGLSLSILYHKGDRE